MVALAAGGGRVDCRDGRALAGKRMLCAQADLAVGMVAGQADHRVIESTG